MGHELAIAGFPFAGKTGSAEAPAAEGTPENEAHEGWFVAFAPPENARILIAVRLERVGSGKDAARIVRAVLDRYRSMSR